MNYVVSLRHGSTTLPPISIADSNGRVMTIEKQIVETEREQGKRRI